MNERDVVAAYARMGPAERQVVQGLADQGSPHEALTFAEIFAYFPGGVRLATEEEISRLNDSEPEPLPEVEPVHPASATFRIPEGPRGSKAGMARESVDVKGRRLLTEGRLQVTRVDPDARLIVAKCRGDSAEIYDLGFDPRTNEWRCTCEARSTCAHLVALKLVTVKHG
jgi:hypothetical protein